MYGEGLQNLEYISLDIIQDSLDSIRSHDGRAFDIHKELKHALVMLFLLWYESVNSMYYS